MIVTVRLFACMAPQWVELILILILMQYTTIDLKKVVPKNILTDAWMAESMSEYNKRRFVIAEGDTSKV